MITNCRLPRKLPHIVVKFQYAEGAKDKFKNDMNRWFPMMELNNFTFFKNALFITDHLMG